ncbi:MAG TPA: hypothetical protein VI997_07295 [Candidatus Thermoplasmatota archaeon]|nr:hypothetical protein [Candidatus Thermoplasmatota archaeon]
MTRTALVLAVLALAGCAAPADDDRPAHAPPVGPPAASALREAFTLVDCVGGDVTVITTVDEARANMPPGFEPGNRNDPPLQPAYGGFNLNAFVCGEVHLPNGPVLAEVPFFLWRLGAIPPAEYMEGAEDPGYCFLTWMSTPQAALAQVLAAWGIGGLDNVSVEPTGMSPATPGLHVSATSNGTVFEFSSTVSPVFVPEGFGAGELVRRYFGVQAQEVLGAVDLRVNQTAGVHPGETDYSIQGGDGVFARPPGRTNGNIVDPPGITWEFERVTLPEASS